MDGVRWVQGKDLPETLAGLEEKVCESIGPRPEVPYAKRGWERCDMKKYPASSSLHAASPI